MYYLSSKSFLILSAVSLLAVVMWFSLGHQSQAAGNTYYVATNGSDSNAGTQSQPWRTAQHASNSANSGDVIYFRQGTYHGFAVTTSGTQGNPITYQSYPGERATFDIVGQPLYATTYSPSTGDINFGAVLNLDGHGWLVFKDVTFTNSNSQVRNFYNTPLNPSSFTYSLAQFFCNGPTARQGISLTKGYNTIFENVEVSYLMGGWIGNSSMDPNSWIKVINSHTHHGADQGFYVKGANIQIIGGEVDHFWNIGIRTGNIGHYDDVNTQQYEDNPGLLIDGVKIHDITGWGVAYLGQGPCPAGQSSGSPWNLSFGYQSQGINPYNSANSSNMIIRNNIIWNVGQIGIALIARMGTGSGIYNNSIINTTGGNAGNGILVSQNQNGRVSVKNNLAYGFTGVNGDGTSQPGNIMGHNYYFASGINVSNNCCEPGVDPQ